ncbi:hypothetical protein Bbelb_279130, partial [Branchiostoma belcheri]
VTLPTKYNQFSWRGTPVRTSSLSDSPGAQRTQNNRKRQEAFIVYQAAHPADIFKARTIA